MIKTAWEEENFSYDGVANASDLQKALQLDAYYATMVRGASVNTALTPNIWCPHDELEHTGKENEDFFKAMWKARPLPAKICVLLCLTACLMARRLGFH